ncbi:hypothetical protein PROFUN_08668 [Planoprotostelium fungivorum]|uniref:Importin N-terminal domain-containing protein n=1 Tax=Planoprotostelium fungivorum TaxID=1890364 RepID=A0A2P6NJ67_9EUKA|nr:hypothetical protein PROFUN_08668 [Planoprotostelium fungivorum]
MDAQQLSHFENLSMAVLYSTNSSERAVAEEQLAPFSTRPEAAGQLSSVLDNSTNPCAIHFAAHALTKLLTQHWNHFTITMRVDIRNHLLNLLASKGPTLENYVIVPIIQLIVRITKLGWFDEGSAHQTIFDEINKFLSASSGHYFLGLRMFNMLVGEINDQQSGQSYTAHRKTANSFRDKSLLKIFQISLTSLRELWSRSMADTQLHTRLKEQALELSFRCLSFDFIGTAPEDTVDDIGVVQIPTSWKSMFEDDSIIKLFLSIYGNSTPPVSVQAMKCIVQIGSISRSAFSGPDERDRFLKYLMEGVTEILRHNQGLNEQGNHHEFCRLLARVKNNFQLTHIISAEGSFPEALSHVSRFTISTLNNWEWSPNSIYYLLSFWSRLIISISYNKDGVFEQVQKFVPQIFRAYVDSRMDSVQKCIRKSPDSDTDIMLDDEEMLSEQVDALPHLGRCNYEESMRVIVALFDPLSNQYKQAAESGALNNPELRREFRSIQGKLAWLIQIIGSIIGGRQNMNDNQDDIDGELVARVFGFLISHDASQTKVPMGPSKERLEKTLLDFIEQYRKGYIGDTSRPSTKMHSKMIELLGLTNDMAVLSLIMNKIGNVFKHWGNDDEIIQKALNLLNELTSGFSSIQRILRLDVTNQFLSFHTSQTFPFLDVEPYNRRSIYYAALSRLLFLEDNIGKFETFMEPFKQKMIYTSEQLSVGNKGSNVQAVVVGVLRDFIGIISASKGRKSYCTLFDWLYPDYFAVFRTLSEVFWDNQTVMIPLLKLTSDLAFNCGGRITFDASSVNGILLFREISAILVTFGSRIFSYTPSSNPYKEKYKSISLCLQMLTRSLLGNYLNFGVFELYGDPTLSDALSVAIKLATSVTMSDILAYPKLQKSYYGFIEVLSGNQTSIVAKLESSVFSGVIHTLKEGLESFEVGVVTQCAISIDRIVSFSMNNSTKAKDLPLITLMKQRVAECNDNFCNILEILLKKILFDNLQNQWSLSRPILSLMLLNPQYFSQLEAKLVEIQPADRRPQLKKHFDETTKKIPTLDLTRVK